MQLDHCKRSRLGLGAGDVVAEGAGSGYLLHYISYATLYLICWIIYYLLIPRAQLETLCCRELTFHSRVLLTHIKNSDLCLTRGKKTEWRGEEVILCRCQ